MSRGRGTTREANIWMETCNKEDKIQKKADKMFFDRDKIRWVSWDSGIDSVKAVAGEEALNRTLTKKKESDPDERTPVKIHYPTTKSRVFCTVD